MEENELKTDTPAAESQTQEAPKAAKKLTHAEKKADRRARRLRWKQARKDARQAKKDHYKDAPWLTRVWHLYLAKPLLVLVILAFVFSWSKKTIVNFVNSDTFVNMVLTYYENAKDKPAEKEEIYKLSPLDEEGGARIDAMDHYGADDTWAVYVYIVGSNLEDLNENDLSPLTSTLTQPLYSENSSKSSAAYQTLLSQFMSELGEKGLDLPEYMYEVDKPTASTSVVTRNVVATDCPGAASLDIAEMTSGTWSDQITLVLQTGGATRWSNAVINPNKTQRFTYHSGEFREIDSMSLQDSCDPDTLADFLTFCKKEYPADHTIVLLWDHGGGAFGYGSDSITASHMTITDLENAFNKAFKANSENPPIELLGFDACLMSSLEVIHRFDGIAKYMAVSEETEPGDGWNYGEWLRPLSEDLSLNGAQVGRYIADSFQDYYMTENVNVGGLFGSQTTTFSVIDVAKTEEVYDAYCALVKKQLEDAIDNISTLSAIGRAAASSPRFAGDAYDIFNTIDLGVYMDNLIDLYPEESTQVKQLLQDAVLYHRESGYLSDSYGISVYFPVEIDDNNGMFYFLKYLDEPCRDESTKALYYYKIAGCLNDDLQQYATDEGMGEAKALDTSLFKAYQYLDPTIEADSYKITIDSELESLMQDAYMEVAFLDQENQRLRYYGTDELVNHDGNGSLCSEFDGLWPALDGEFLNIEIVSRSSSGVSLRSKVLHNGSAAWLMFSYDYDTETYTINGVYDITDQDAENILSRSTSDLKPGDTIVPIYKIQDTATNTSAEENGKSIKFSDHSDIKNQALDSGTYLTSIIITDPRGDEYYSAVVDCTVSSGKVTGTAVDTAFMGR